METIAPAGRTTIGTVNVGGARPTAAGDGVAAAPGLSAGTLSSAIALAYIEGNGSGQTLASPTGGTAGPELWGYRKAGDGVTAKWWLLGSLNKGVTIPVGAAGGYIEALPVGAPMFDRLCVAGIPAAATAMTYYFEAIERHLG